ncbi:MAG: hypothetical protein LBT10_08100 [Methanobrevibacter sp.]|jgi:hypothetical protein|nr:hypothetical protein [Methanobrevibacter sp.]
MDLKKIAILMLLILSICSVSNAVYIGENPIVVKNQYSSYTGVAVKNLADGSVSDTTILGSGQNVTYTINDTYQDIIYSINGIGFSSVSGYNTNGVLYRIDSRELLITVPSGITFNGNPRFDEWIPAKHQPLGA